MKEHFRVVAIESLSRKRAYNHYLITMTSLWWLESAMLETPFTYALLWFLALVVGGGSFVGFWLFVANVTEWGVRGRGRGEWSELESHESVEGISQSL
jgi:hypothetical protein